MYAILVLVLVPAVLAYPSGPPVVSFPNLCTDMIPSGHNGGTSKATDQATPPYTITSSSASYTAGGSLTVTITGTGGNMFKGFFIQARRADPSLDNDVAIGTFAGVPANTQLIMCHTVNNSAWGHSTGEARSSITATWNAPAQCEGPIEFKATIVKGVPDFSYFYLGVKSAEQVMASGCGSAPPPTDTAPPSKASLTVPLALTTLALGLLSFLAGHRQ